MADKLLRVNDGVSVKASQVIAVTRTEFSNYVKVHTADGACYDLSYSGNPWEGKRAFEQQVNDALAGD